MDHYLISFVCFQVPFEGGPVGLRFGPDPPLNYNNVLINHIANGIGTIELSNLK